MSATRTSSSPAEPVRHVDRLGDLEVTTIGIDSSHVTVQLRGELDLASAALLTAVLDNLLSLGCRFARLDTSRLAFCDCAGLRAIVSGHNAFLAARGTLSLIRPSPRLVRLLSITGLDEALFVADRTADARTGPHRHFGVVARRRRRPGKR
jgi:anti-sigma B factor antagonist